MCKEYIAVIDSGVGGISTLLELKNNFPSEQYIYLGDNSNAPYGNKSKSELVSLMIDNLFILNFYKIKLIVIGCNTMSLAIHREIEEYTGIKTVCVFPPVESELIKGNNTLLLSTYYTAQKYVQYKHLSIVGFYNLAKDIEGFATKLFKIDMSNEIDASYISTQFLSNKKKFDTIILGCTHYEFIKKEISDHFCCKNFISGNYFLIKKLKKTFSNLKTSLKTKRNEVLFIGKNSKINQLFYDNVVINTIK